MSERIDLQNAGKMYARALARLPHDDTILPENRKIMLRFLRDAELGKTIRNAQKKKIGYGRLLRSVGILKIMSRDWFKKPFPAVTSKDMEDFVLQLEKGKVKNQHGNPYKSETQKTIKKFIKKFYKWLLGNGTTYPEMVAWIDTSGQIPEIQALKREEVERLVARAGNPRNKAIVKLLFDSGARIEEFLNVRMADLDWKGDYYLVRIQHSKTKPRTISIPLSTKELNDWLAEHPDRKNGNAFLFDMRYHQITMMLKRLGEKVLKKNVTPHILRHSSATHYANLLKHYQFCYRYGWSMSSDSPNRYIDRNGIYEQETAEVVKVDEINKFKKENEVIKEDFTLLKERFDKMNDIMVTLIKDKQVANILVKKIDKLKLGDKLR